MRRGFYSLNRRVWLAIGTVILSAGIAHAAAPMPFPAAAPPADPSWLGSFFMWLQETQQYLYRGLASAVRATKEEGSISALGTLLGLSFFYGVIHAAGPGHGKAVISAYLVAKESAVRRGIALAFVSALAQGVTAILIVGVIAAIFGLLFKDIEGIAAFLEQASYLLIAGIGALILVQTTRGILRARAGRAAHDHHGHIHSHTHQHDRAAAHAHHHHIGPEATASVSSWRQGLAIATAVGVRPCMGAVLVLFFALAQGVFFFGVLATIAMSIGTAITVAALAILSSGARQTALRIAGGMDGWGLRVYWALSLAGGSALLLIGAGLFLMPGAPPPFPGSG